MKYFSAALLIIMGVVGLITAYGQAANHVIPQGLSAFTYPLGWVVFGFISLSYWRLMKGKDDIIAAKDKHIRQLGEMMQSHMTDNENLQRNNSHLQSKLNSLQTSLDLVERSNNNNLLIVRRLNRILADNNIDTTAANIPPASEGGELRSSRVARENPTPPPRLADNLRPEVVRSGRSSMASPHQSAAPVSHDDGPGFGTGLLVGHMLFSDSSSPRSEPTPSRCDPTPSYSEPTRSDPSPSYDPPSSTSDYGGGGGGGGCD